MRTVRAIYRLLLFVFSTLLYYLLLWGGMALLLPVSSKSRMSWKQFIIRNWARTTARIIGMKVTVHGVPPKAPFILVSNHLSYVDIIAFFTCLDCVFVAKKELKTWPVMGLLARTANTIFIDRQNIRDIRKVNEQISGSLGPRQGVIFFPEGTSSAGWQVNPFKSPLLEVPAAQNLPVSYASISYRCPAGEPSAHLVVCWWGDMTFPRHLFNLFKIRHFYATLTFGEMAIQEKDRKTLAKKLWFHINQQFIPVTENHTGNGKGESMSPERSIIAENIAFLEQGISLLQYLDDGLYANHQHEYFSSGVGKHVRHVLDHYASFISGLPKNLIDYDARERDPRLENDRHYAVKKVYEIIDQLKSAFSITEDLERTVWVHSNETAAVESPGSRSSLKRELQYLLSHTVHHYALIAILLRVQGFHPPATFGVAPSTLQYLQIE